MEWSAGPERTSRQERGDAFAVIMPNRLPEHRNEPEVAIKKVHSDDAADYGKGFPDNRVAELLGHGFFDLL